MKIKLSPSFLLVNVMSKSFRIQTSQNKCIHFCPQLDKMSHISQKQFEIIIWLPIKERYSQCINSIALKYVDNQCPHYLNKVFMKAPESSSSQQPFHKINTGHNALYFIGLTLQIKVPKEIKRTTNLNALKHNLKKHYLKELGKANF